MIDYGLLTRIPLMNQAVGLPAGEEPVEVCCAGADLYYLSVEAWDRFAAIVQNAWTPANTSASAILHMFENEVASVSNMDFVLAFFVRFSWNCFRKELHIEVRASVDTIGFFDLAR